MRKQFTFLLLAFLSANTFVYAGCSGPYLSSDRGGSCPNGGMSYGPGYVSGNPDTVAVAFGASDTVHFSLYSDPGFCPPMDSVRWFRDGVLLYAAPIGALHEFRFAATGPGTYTCTFNYWGMHTIYSITFLAATPVPELSSEEEPLRIYPNPSANGIYTVSTAGNNVYTIQVLDISGRVVYELKGNEQQITLDLSDHTPGFYSLVYTDANGRKRVKKMVYN
ncbi:MAG: hypothetical protein JWO09_2340 [Bacteroidetes bacterium]|nr:hypothetical protein [Bacteroidota bacterium]